MTAQNAGFPKSYRLLKRPDFVRVQRGGKRLRGRHFSLCVSKNSEGHVRFGFTVSKKIGNAVVRNAVKRKLREICRHLKHEVEALDIVVLARPSIVDRSVEQLERELRKVLSLSPPHRGAEEGSVR